MAIDQITTSGVLDGTLTSSDLNASVSLGEGFYQGGCRGGEPDFSRLGLRPGRLQEGYHGCYQQQG